MVSFICVLYVTLFSDIMLRTSTRKRTATAKAASSRIVTSRQAASVRSTTSTSPPGRQTLPKVARTGTGLNQSTHQDGLTTSGILPQQPTPQQPLPITSNSNRSFDNGPVTILYSRVDSTVPIMHGTSTFVRGTATTSSYADTTSTSSTGTSADGTTMLHGNVNMHESQTGNNSVPNTSQIHAQPPNMVVSVDDDISIHVSQNIKDKIIQGQYVDLAMLISSSNTDTLKQKLVFEQGELTIQPNTKLNKISNIETWTDAFLIFTSVFCSIHMSRLQEMLKYMNSVRLGAKRCNGNGWKIYDEQYRLRKARNPSSSWGLIDTELWLIYMQPIATGTGVNYLQPTQNRNQNLKCYSYNYEGVCNKIACFYQHKCMKCENFHPLIRCQMYTPPRFMATNNLRPAITPTSYHDFQPRIETPRFGFRPRNAQYHPRGKFIPRPLGPRFIPN